MCIRDRLSSSFSSQLGVFTAIPDLTIASELRRKKRRSKKTISIKEARWRKDRLDRKVLSSLIMYTDYDLSDPLFRSLVSAFFFLRLSLSRENSIS